MQNKTQATPIKFRLQSAGFINAPGFVAWLISGARFEKDKSKLAKIACDTWQGLPKFAAEKLLSGEIAYQVDSENAVCFEA